MANNNLNETSNLSRQPKLKVDFENIREDIAELDNVSHQKYGAHAISFIRYSHSSPSFFQ